MARKISPKKAAAAALAAATSPGPVTNCVWSNNNAACVDTWFCLSKSVLGQIDVSFDEAESTKVGSFAFWNDVAPGDNAEIEARALADILTKLFTNMLGATYEPGHNYASAVEAMTVVLANPAKTVCELAAVVDELHHFTTET